MRVTLKGINSIRKKLADGSFKTYYYAWKGGPPLRGEPGTREFHASYNAAVTRKIEPPSGALQTLLNGFQESADFQFGISARTRRDYVKQIQRIEHEFSDFPIKALTNPQARSVFLEWRDNWRKARCAKPITLITRWPVFSAGRRTAARLLSTPANTAAGSITAPAWIRFGPMSTCHAFS